MNRINTTFIALISLTMGIGCKGIGGDIAGEWEGEIECSEYSMDIEFELKREDKDTFTGTGSIDTECTFSDGYSYWVEDCTVDFDVEAKTEGKLGEQDVEFELDNCEVDGDEIDCPEDGELTWE